MSQLHSTDSAQRFWTLLYLDNKPYENEASRHQRKQQQRRDEVTSDRYYGGPPSKSLVVRGARCVFVRDDIALPTTRGFFGNGALAEAETSSADKFREEPSLSWRRLENRQVRAYICAQCVFTMCTNIYIRDILRGVGGNRDSVSIYGSYDRVMKTAKKGSIF